MIRPRRPSPDPREQYLGRRTVTYRGKVTTLDLFVDRSHSFVAVTFDPVVWRSVSKNSYEARLFSRRGLAPETGLTGLTGMLRDVLVVAWKRAKRTQS